MKSALKILTGVSATVVLASVCTIAIAEIASYSVTFAPTYDRMLLGLGVFGLLGIAYGLLDRKAPATPPVQSPPEIPPKTEEDIPPAPKGEEGLSVAYEQLRTYIDLEMWELALDRAISIQQKFPDSREAKAIGRNINDLRWKAEPKFVERNSKSVSKKEANELETEGLSRFVQHIRTYMELEMWSLAQQKAASLMKSFPESESAKEVAKLWPEINRRKKETTQVGTTP